MIQETGPISEKRRTGWAPSAKLLGGGDQVPDNDAMYELPKDNPVLEEPRLQHLKKYLKDLGIEASNELFQMSDLYQITSAAEDDIQKPSAPLQFLQNLFKLDFRCRNTVSDNNEEEKDEEVDNGDDDDDDDFFGGQQAENENDRLSNRDNVLCALNLLDDFVLQEAFGKMSSCQLSTPIAMPSFRHEKDLVFHLWASRGIKKKWMNSSQGNTGRGQICEGSVSTYKFNTISFCRFGTLAESKSGIVNTFLSDGQGGKEQSIFLTKDKDNKSLHNQGVIENCWFCPEGGPAESLKDLTCIYNLRGDAREFKKQFDFLQKVSSCLVIFVEEPKEEDQALIKAIANQTYTVLVNMNIGGKSKKAKDGKRTVLPGNNKNVGELSKNLVDCVKYTEDQQRMSLEEHATIAEEIGFAVDESCQDYAEAKEAADKLMVKIEQCPEESRKSKILPLQGQLWKEWADIDKEEAQLKAIGTQNVETYKSKLSDKKRDKRIEQKQMVRSEVLQDFIETVSKFKGDRRRFYLSWLQIRLNTLSEDLLPKVLRYAKNESIYVRLCYIMESKNYVGLS